MYVFYFDFEGIVKMDCDWCLVFINFFIEGVEWLLVKYFLEEILEEVEVIFIYLEIFKLDVFKYVYEFICLVILMIKIYDC